MTDADDITILIDDSLGKSDIAAFLFEGAQTVLAATRLADVVPTICAAQDAAMAGKWVAGFISYEAAPAFDEALQTHPASGTLPLVWFAICDAPQILTPAQADKLWEGAPESRATGLTLPLDRAAYTDKIEKIQNYLSAGDAYQINFTMNAAFDWEGSTRGLYRELRQSQRTHHSAYIETGDWAVLSLSPELFLTRNDNHLTTMPMKGTAPRPFTLDADIKAAAALQQDTKSRAENLMIVDLLRNDLSRVTTAGSVKVDDLFAVEHYPGLHTLTSRVSGSLQDDMSFADIMRALFPCGSVTGAPKARAMQIIHELEDAPRSVYTGAIGMIKPGGDFSFNVAIRTPVLFPDGTGIVGLGSGIVADSKADAEYDECLLKGRFLTDPLPPFELFETTIWQRQSGFRNLPGHFARLEKSARYFGFNFDQDVITDHLSQAADGFSQADTYRVRFAIDRYGTVTLRAVPLENWTAPDNGEIAIALARTNSQDLFLHHKTSHRPLYDQAMLHAADAGLIDYIFVNEHGEVTEGAKTNLFIVKDGQWLTPSLACGVLPGTERAAIIAAKAAHETIIMIDDMIAADQLYVCNGVIGLVPVTLRPIMAQQG